MGLGACLTTGIQPGVSKYSPPGSAILGKRFGLRVHGNLLPTR